MKNITLIALLLIGCSVPERQEKVIARVGDARLTLDDIVEVTASHPNASFAGSDLRDYILRWINDEVLYQEALALGFDRDEKLQRELERIKKQLIINNLVERALNNDVAVTEREIVDYYETNKAEFIVSEDQVHAYHVLTKTRQQAVEVRKRLREGEPFEAVAREMHSDSLDSVDWDLGYFSKDEMIPEISKQAFSLPVGNLSLPIKSDYGYHVIKVVDRLKENDTKRLDQVRDEIRFMLEQQKKQDNYQRFLLQTKSKFNVETNFEILNSVKLDSLIKNGATLN